jgi:hypothetical protein
LLFHINTHLKNKTFSNQMASRLPIELKEIVALYCDPETLNKLIKLEHYNSILTNIQFQKTYTLQYIAIR